MGLGRRPGINETIESINIHISMLQGSTSDMKNESVTPHVKNNIPIEEFKVKRGDTIETKGILNFIVTASAKLAKYVQGDKAMDTIEKDQIINQAVLINDLATRMLAEVDSLDILRGRNAYNVVTKVYQEAILIKPIKVSKRVA